MAVPNTHVSDIDSVNAIAGASNAILKIKSMVTELEVHFPAFLTDFSQTFDAKWNSEEVFGRMDPIATYQGTTRTMSLGFDIPAGSMEEARTNLIKTQRLVKMVYPVYNSFEISKATKKKKAVYSGPILSKPPLVRIEFANLIKSDGGEVIKEKEEKEKTQEEDKKEENAKAADQIAKPEETEASSPQTSFGLLGWIGGLSWKPNLEMGMFSGAGELYPKVISVSFQFNILHEKTLNQESAKLNNWPFGVTDK
tara:strand:+ start:425 stop:1183 length:759 start_codon:yes stop_codon:yes gene_type:complete